MQWQLILSSMVYTGIVLVKVDEMQQAEACRQMVVDALEDLKAVDIVGLDVRDRASFTDFMVFASGTSSRHVGAIAESVIARSTASDTPPMGVEGDDIGEWILIDLGDVVVHIMLPEVRAYYELEKLWGEELVNP